MKQHTLSGSFTLSSKGLHTGLLITATVSPAEADTGVQICRTDLPGQPTYRALADYVSATERGTVLQQGEWRVSTVEHLLSALYALGVDNCLICVDGPEVPILDGSARPWIEAILAAGLQEQDAEQQVFVVTEPITFETEQGNRMLLTPCDHQEVEVVIDFGSELLGRQQAVLTDFSDYAEQISSARTFCFLREIEPLLRAGLIRGGDLQNALVIYDRLLPQQDLDMLADRLGQPHLDASRLGYMSPLKYDNEPARHKLLDVIGDMSLLGMRIRGRIYAERPGHGFNTTCCRQLRTQFSIFNSQFSI